MDQSTIPDAQENRNHPLHQRSPPRHPRIPYKLWMRDDSQPVMRQPPGIVTDETCSNVNSGQHFIIAVRSIKTLLKAFQFFKGSSLSQG